MSPVCIVCTTLLEFRWNTVTLRGRWVRSGGVYRGDLSGFNQRATRRVNYPPLSTLLLQL